MEIDAAVVTEEGGAFEIESIDLEEPQAGEVLVRVVGTGVFDFLPRLKPWDSSAWVIQAEPAPPEVTFPLKVLRSAGSSLVERLRCCHR